MRVFKGGLLTQREQGSAHPERAGLICMNQPCYDTEQLTTSAGAHVTAEKNRVGSAILASSNKVTWVQTERATHEAWGRLTTRSPRAAAMVAPRNDERRFADIDTYSGRQRPIG